jgi:hypothetical protein
VARVQDTIRVHYTAHEYDHVHLHYVHVDVRVPRGNELVNVLLPSCQDPIDFPLYTYLGTECLRVGSGG